jgi:hypothetical protein
MSIQTTLSFAAAVIMFVFAAFVLQRYATRRKPFNLFWGLGLLMFAVASFSGSYLSLQWSRTAFFAWYYFGAVITAAWIGQGTVYLLARKRRANILAGILIAGSLLALLLMFSAMTKLDETAYSANIPISEQYREIMPPIGEGGLVRLSTPFFNVYGLVTLAGGALWSTFQYWRKREMGSRAVGNILIAAGAIAIALAGTLTRFGYGSLLYLGELLAAILMFSGFLFASAAPRKAAAADQAVTKAA